MTKSKNQDARGGPSSASVTKTTSSGRDVWHVKHKDGRSQKLTTTRSSNAAIKEGVSTYRSALRNLAKK
jgi:hypothetical protein